MKNYTFYATVDIDSLSPQLPEGIAILLPASSWSRIGLKAPKIPSQITRTAADCGGYIASKIWGEYRYTEEQYVNWLLSFTPEWAAMMDYCCEADLPEAGASKTRINQQRTTEKANYLWQNYKQAPFIWIPTIQGWTVAEYQQHAYELKPLIDEMSMYYGKNSAFRVGIGTLCQRASIHTIQEIIEAISLILPDMPLHLWGVKLRALHALKNYQQIVSSDSAAYHGKFGSRENRERLKAAAAAAGMSLRSYSLKVSLPAYIKKAQAAAADWTAIDTDTSPLEQLREQLKREGWTLKIRSRGNTQYAYAQRKHEGRPQERYIGKL